MGLGAGREVDIVFTDGRLEIELAPARVRAETGEGLPRLVPEEDLPELTDEDVRGALEAARR
jgi:hypothetical protein